MSNARILVCDDDPTTRFVLKRFLGREGVLAVTEAENGACAIRALGQDRYDLVILDLDMPVMNGRETLRLIRETPALRSVPVLVLTAERGAQEVQQVIRLGVQGFLLKPVSGATAQERLRQVLAGLRPSDAAPAA